MCLLYRAFAKLRVPWFHLREKKEVWPESPPIAFLGPKNGPKVSKRVFLYVLCTVRPLNSTWALRYKHFPIKFQHTLRKKKEVWSFRWRISLKNSGFHRKIKENSGYFCIPAPWGSKYLSNRPEDAKNGFSRKFYIDIVVRNFFPTKNFHRKKKFWPNVFIFYFLIISHPQPMQVASRNSPWAARGRYKRNPKIAKIRQIVNFSKSQ